MAAVFCVFQKPISLQPRKVERRNMQIAEICKIPLDREDFDNGRTQLGSWKRGPQPYSLFLLVTNIP